MITSIIRLKQRKVGNNCRYSYKICCYGLNNKMLGIFGSIGLKENTFDLIGDLSIFKFKYSAISKKISFNILIYFNYKRKLTFLNFLLNFENCFLIYNLFKFNKFLIVGLYSQKIK